MPVYYDPSLKNTRMTVTRDHFANGTLEILTATDVLLVAFGLADDGGTVSNGVWTLAFDFGTVPAVGAGDAAKAQVKTGVVGGGLAHLTGLTVGTAGTDVILPSLAIVVGQNVTLTAATVTHAL